MGMTNLLKYRVILFNRCVGANEEIVIEVVDEAQLLEEIVDTFADHDLLRYEQIEKGALKA